MFGIDKITWGSFTGFLLFILLLWYLIVMFWAWYKGKSSNRKQLFENDSPTPVLGEAPLPIPVSSQDFPAQLIPLRFCEDIPLPVSLYEETGIDDGYAIECFTSPNNPGLPLIMEQLRFQQ